MVHDEIHTERTNGGSAPRPRSSRTKVWVIGSDDGACDHPDPDLQRVGSDGINAYYRCVRCEAVLVSQDEIVRAARASSKQSG